MELRNFAQVIWQRIWIILLAVIMVTGMTYYLSLITTPVYSASTTLEVTLGLDPSQDQYSSLVSSARVAVTYVEQIKSPVILQQAIDELGLTMPVAELAKAVTAQQIRDTQLIQLTVEDPNPALAKELASRIADLFISYVQTRQQARYESGLTDLGQQIAELEAQIEETQKALSSLGDPSDLANLRMPEVARLELAVQQSKLTSQQTRYTILLRSAEDFRLASARYTDSLTVFSPAEMPLLPVRPRVALNTVLGLISGLVLGLSTAFLLEYLDDTIKSAEVVTEALGLTVLGDVGPMGRLKDLAKGLVTVLKPGSHLAESYRMLRNNLQFTELGNPHGTLLVTSPNPSAGKTTTLANLGVAMAEVGKRVILVDTDLRRPALHAMFDRPQDWGLTNVILGEADVDQVLQETDVPGLRLLTTGPLPPNPATVLASPAMARVLDELKDIAEVILFDSPPILGMADAAILATRMDGVLLVIDTGITTRDGARKAKEALDNVQATLLGAVMNKEKGRHGGYYYNYYYYYSSPKGERKREKRGRASDTN